MKIELIDNYADEPAKIAKDLEALAYLLGEREEEVYRCTCEDDPEHPRGSWEYDTNAYNHGRECPSGLAYHHQVLLLGLARYFDARVGKEVGQ